MRRRWEQAVGYWCTLPFDADAVFDRSVTLYLSAIAPRVSWGTSPDDGAPITGLVPDCRHRRRKRAQDA